MARTRTAKTGFEAFSQKFLIGCIVVFVFGFIFIKSVESSYSHTAQVLEEEISTMQKDIDSLEMQKQELASFSRLTSVASAQGYTYTNDAIASSTASASTNQ